MQSKVPSSSLLPFYPSDIQDQKLESRAHAHCQLLKAASKVSGSARLIRETHMKLKEIHLGQDWWFFLNTRVKTAKARHQIRSGSETSAAQHYLPRRTEMNSFDLLLQRNKDFAAQQSTAGTLMPSLPRALPNVKAVIIGCADMRVDPADVLGIKPGEAVVMRNIGGRITPELLEQLGMLGRIGEVAGEIPGGGGEFHIIVLHHTDCGITRLVGDPAILAQYFQIRERELETKAVTDPRASVAVDVAALRAIPALPSEWLISGLVYDVATGLVEIVVPPAPIRKASSSTDQGRSSGLSRVA
jgi:carbonic anhydrase